MDIFTALSDPSRREILEMLADSGPLTATEIYGRFKVSHPAISQHLQALRAANCVLVKKKGQQRLYRINPEAMHTVESWAERMTHLWEERFSALDRVLQQELEKQNPNLIVTKEEKDHEQN
jgi:DNA-binding transcriptional ArsR family regulator